MIKMQQMMGELAKSLVAGMVILAFVTSLLAGGFLHSAAASCLPPAYSASALDSKADQPGKFAAVAMDKDVRFAVDGHMSKGSSNHNQTNCCDNLCPPLLFLSDLIATSLPSLEDIEGTVPYNSLRTTDGLCLERPPKSLLT
jgi:hypothetical protein